MFCGFKQISKIKLKVKEICICDIETRCNLRIDISENSENHSVRIDEASRFVWMKIRINWGFCSLLDFIFQIWQHWCDKWSEIWIEFFKTDSITNSRYLLLFWKFISFFSFNLSNFKESESIRKSGIICYILK